MYLRAVEGLWRRGNLRFLLDETQLRIAERLEGTAQRKFYLLCSRRLGKTFMLVVLAFSLCLRKPGARVLYLAPFAKDAADLVNDIAAAVLETCPPELKPDFKAQSKEYTFANGSVIRFKGVNGEHAQYLRGGAYDLVVLDECGIMDDLRHVVNDIVMPMTLTTGGRILLATTPPRTPGHDSALIYEECAGLGATVTFTLLDNVRVSEEVKAEFLRAAGESPEDIPFILAGVRRPKTTTALREYFCVFVTDADSAVLPEFSGAKDEIICDSPRPPYFDAYVSMDPGMRDRTALLYAVTDWRRGKLIVEDESLLQRPSSLVIAEELGKKEYALWRDKAPLVRVSDIDEFLIKDLWVRHQIVFKKAQKQDSIGAINLVRNMIQIRQLEIHPRCVHLIRQCENAIWNNKGTDFARVEDGHFDLVASLKYLCRTVNLRHNPYPPSFKDRPFDRFTSPRSPLVKGRRDLGLMADTPFARKVAQQKAKRLDKFR